jgi:ribonuclease-3
MSLIINQKKLEEKLSYIFIKSSFLEKALTHSSAISPAKRVEFSYQRLEFLGDRVLGLVVSDILLNRFPNANEGELSRTLNTLVRKETLAEVAKSLDLGKFVILGESEAKSGGANKEAILADVLEAIIGAAYCDGGHDKAYKLVENLFASIISKANERGADAKTFLQEWAQARKLATPIYTELSRTGPDHAPVFIIEVSVEGYLKISASGSSKKIAEHSAAQEFLVSEKIWKNHSKMSML